MSRSKRRLTLPLADNRRHARSKFERPFAFLSIRAHATPLPPPFQSRPHIQPHAMARASTNSPLKVFSNRPPRYFSRSPIAVAGIVPGKRQRHSELSPRLLENPLLQFFIRKFLTAQIVLDRQRSRGRCRDPRQPPQRSPHSTGRSPRHRRPALPPRTLRGIRATPPNIPAHIPAPVFGSPAFAAVGPSFPVSLDTARSWRSGISMTPPLSIVRPSGSVLARTLLLAAVVRTTPFPILAEVLRQKSVPVITRKLSSSASRFQHSPQ